MEIIDTDKAHLCPILLAHYPFIFHKEFIPILIVIVYNSDSLTSIVIVYNSAIFFQNDIFDEQ